jgi:hypothetical protein
MSLMARLIFATLVLALTLLFAGRAFATERSVSLKFESSDRELKIKIEDKDQSPQACDYYVERMRYDSQNRILAVNLAEEPCFTPVIGKKKARLRWYLPRSLHMSDFCLKVDNQNLAKINLEAHSARVTGSCE